MTVLQLFERLRGRDVSLLPNPGNCGDGLIALGLRALIRTYSIRVVELRHPLPASGRVLLAPACGNLCSFYHGMTDLIPAYAGSFERVYILPCSVDTEEPRVAAFLRALPSHVEIFCREPYSYARARFLIPQERVHLDHDLAFSYNYEPWKIPGRGRLNAFRTDPESIGWPIPPDNIDVSALGSQRDGELLPRLLRHYETVYTDRAHVAICAAMLDKETHVYPNGYHKVRGIYEYSLRSLPNVHFHGVDELLAIQEAV
jgi:exopolysaccharide biosynthesis predicted pyruvyltransferase EpsI